MTPSELEATIFFLLPLISILSYLKLSFTPHRDAAGGQSHYLLPLNCLAVSDFPSAQTKFLVGKVVFGFSLQLIGYWLSLGFLDFCRCWLFSEGVLCSSHCNFLFSLKMGEWEIFWFILNGCWDEVFFFFSFDFLVVLSFLTESVLRKKIWFWFFWLYWSFGWMDVYCLGKNWIWFKTNLKY